MFPRQSLPQELIDYIIDYLHQDRASLRICSVVSKRWAHSAQSHLFSTVLVLDGSHLDELTKLFDHRPHLALHVRRLHLKAYRHWMSHGASPELLTWIRAVPQVLSRKLPRVRALHFEHVQWDMFRIDNAFLADLASFTRVQELAFSSCNFTAFRSFEQLVLVFRDLQRLSLDAVSWRNDRDALNYSPFSLATPRPHLKELRVGRFCHMKTVFDWLLMTPARSSLRNLEVDNVISKEELEQVGLVLKSLGYHLQHLKLGCKFDRAPKLQRTIGDFIDLSCNTELRSLHLLILDLRDDMMLWVPRVLLQMAAPHLEQIRFDLWLYSPVQLISTHWNEISWILAHSRYSTVRDISFVHRGYMDMEKATLSLRKRLEVLDKRQVLSIEDGRSLARI